VQPRAASRQQDAILIVVVLAAAANLVQHAAVFVILLAAIRVLVRESQVIPRALSWYFRPVSAWHIRRLKRRYLGQQRLGALSG
jgi:hypothetical protein